MAHTVVLFTYGGHGDHQEIDAVPIRQSVFALSGICEIWRVTTVFKLKGKLFSNFHNVLWIIIKNKPRWGKSKTKRGGNISEVYMRYVAYQVDNPCCCEPDRDKDWYELGKSENRLFVKTKARCKWYLDAKNSWTLLSWRKKRYPLTWSMWTFLGYWGTEGYPERSSSAGLSETGVLEEEMFFL